MAYQIETFPNGKKSIRGLNFAESMHSAIGPWEEANLIYVGQSRLNERLKNSEILDGIEQQPLVVFDLGLGIAANALALISSYQKISTIEKTRDLHLISFENDLEGLRFALNHIESFPFLGQSSDLVALIWERFLCGAETQSEKRNISLQNHSGARIEWELRIGDFKQEIYKPLPGPELIYFDFYSPKASPELWSRKIFDRLFALASLHSNYLSSTLLTYTSSTAVRSALILAGFQVGYGTRTAAKLETTAACTLREELEFPLGREWEEHLMRSSIPVPIDHGYDNEMAAIEGVIARINGRFG